MVRKMANVHDIMTRQRECANILIPLIMPTYTEENMPNLMIPEKQLEQSCNQCGDSFPLTKHYWHNSCNFKSGLARKCKACTSINQQQRRGKQIIESDDFWRKLEVTKKNIDLAAVGRKICTSCRKEKSFDEYTGSNNSLDGKIALCKGCTSIITKERYARNPEHIIKKSSEYYRKNREAIRIKTNQKYRDNREAMVNKARKFREENPEIIREWARKGYQKRKLVEGSHSNKEVAALIMLQGGQCGACESELNSSFHVDHILAIKNGGDDTINNLQILCSTCNQRKHAKMNDAFLQEYGLG